MIMEIYSELPKGVAIFHKHSIVFNVSYSCDLVRNIDLISSKMECVICKEPVKKSSEGAVLYKKGAKSINVVSLQRGDDIRANVDESEAKEYRSSENETTATRRKACFAV